MGAMGLSIKNVRPKKIDNRFLFFSTKKKVDQKNFDYLFRSQMIPRFQKSHLEQRAIILKMRNTEKSLYISKNPFFPSNHHLSISTESSLRYPLYSGVVHIGPGGIFGILKIFPRGEVAGGTLVIHF